MTPKTPLTHVPLQKWIEPNQVALVLSKAKTIRDKAALALTYQLGLRRSEVSLLKREDYDGTHIEFSHCKGDCPRMKIALWSHTKKILDQYLVTRKDIKDALILSRIGRAMSGQMVYYIYQEAAQAAGLPLKHCHPHTLRHSIAIHLARSGMDIIQIQKFLGHVSPEMSVMYMAGARDATVYNLDSAEKSHHIARFS